MAQLSLNTPPEKTILVWMEPRASILSRRMISQKLKIERMHLLIRYVSSPIFRLAPLSAISSNITGQYTKLLEIFHHQIIFFFISIDKLIYRYHNELNLIINMSELIKTN